MVSVGFIVEGETEKQLLESEMFRQWLAQQGLTIAGNVVDAKGSGNLLPENLNCYVQVLASKSADKIVVLTDLEREPLVERVRARIGAHPRIEVVFVAVKAIESWFLADSDALSRWLHASHREEFPEATSAMPWDRLRELAALYNVRGTGPSKPVFAKRFLAHCAFDLERAAQHLNCPSAREFVETLKQWGAMPQQTWTLY